MTLMPIYPCLFTPASHLPLYYSLQYPSAGYPFCLSSINPMPSVPQYSLQSVASSYQFSISYSAGYSKYLTLLLIQELVRISGASIETYLIMLELLNGLTFEGQFQLSLRVAISLYHLASKFSQSYRPPLQELLQWGYNLVTNEQIVDCQAQIWAGHDFQLPLHLEADPEQMQGFCYELETHIFSSINN